MKWIDIDSRPDVAKFGRLMQTPRAQVGSIPIVKIVDDSGNPVLRTRLQAVRDSYFTFRGKDSMQSNDFRVFAWEEMNLNDYLYASGEVTRLWMHPRGPDSGIQCLSRHRRPLDLLWNESCGACFGRTGVRGPTACYGCRAHRERVTRVRCVLRKR